MFLIESKPVVILANYRTGSSPLCWSIASLNNLIGFPEPFTAFEDRSSEFIKQYNSNEKNFVVKFIGDQIELFEPYSKLLKSDCFKIKLTRRNKIDQIASYYIASMRNVWKTVDTDTKISYNIPIINDKILESIEKITKVDQILDTVNVLFDKEIFYEDFNTIEYTNRIKTYQPVNLKQIKTVIEENIKNA
jgi:LPS sulfotransferase NodH